MPSCSFMWRPADGAPRLSIFAANSIEIKDGRFFIKAKVKGGFFLNFELDDETTKNALFDYLEATNRTDIFGKDEPLWLRHDKGAKSSKKKGLTSHGFARRMEIYATRSRNQSIFIFTACGILLPKSFPNTRNQWRKRRKLSDTATSKPRKFMCRDWRLKRTNIQNLSGTR